MTAIGFMDLDLIYRNLCLLFTFLNYKISQSIKNKANVQERKIYFIVYGFLWYICFLEIGILKVYLSLYALFLM